VLNAIEKALSQPQEQVETKKTYGFKESLGEESYTLLTSRTNKAPIRTRIFRALPLKELRKSKIVKSFLSGR